ncbi:MAG: N-acetylmuramoyl-L-alanine amidase [Minicystis sp.]
MLFALALVTGGAGCGGDPAPATGGGTGLAALAVTSDAERAAAIVQGTAALPPRPEAVAIADAVAIAAHRAGRTPEGARLARLAADLRARLWRFDQTASDAREAVELYATAAVVAGGTDEGCEAERRRALIAGELSRDAGLTYRELYLASRRHQGRLRVAPPGARAEPADAGAAANRCAASLDMALAAAVAYRPFADAMRALEREGDTAADAAERGAAPAPPAAGTVAASAVPAVVVAPAVASGSAAAGPVPPPGDVVVAPKEDTIGKDPVKLLGVEPLSGEDAARVVVRLSGPAMYQVGTLAGEGGKDPRVYLDIARATSRGVTKETASSGFLRRVRLGPQAGGGTRVVLDLAAPAAHRRVFYLPDPFRVVIDVSSRARTAEPAAAPPGPREVRRIALDPGHGGNDAGATGPTGLKEKDVTLDIAHRAAPLLAHELGVTTLLTRDSDVYVPLDLRAARANAFNADLFVSIHCNAAENGAARGVQTFILDEARDPEGFAARVAARENAQRGRDGESLSAAVLTNLNVAAMAARSRHVAELLQRAALGSLQPRYPDTKDQGIKTAGFFVLVGADMPAVLFETAFISNPEEEGRLATADYRQKLADAIVNAVRAYKAGK